MVAVPHLAHHVVLAVENPRLILIVGVVGLGLNLLVMSFLHGSSS
jgi:Co/Zn/Cd efflux system component